MKAVIYEKYGGPEVLELKDVGKPVPGENEVLVKIYAATVSATDPISRKGEPFISRVATGLFKPKVPILGDSFAGIIEAVGQGVTRFKVGDAVFGATGMTAGAHAEYKCLPEDGGFDLKPSNMSFEEAAAIPYEALTALPFLRDKGQIERGQAVLIIGASGSIGTSAVQLAKYFGAHVTGVCSGRNVELVKSLGADEVIDYTSEDFRENGRTYDIIFDTVGKSSFGRSKRSLKPDGIYLLTVPTLGIVGQMLWTSVVGSKKAVFAAAGLRPTSEKQQDLAYVRELIEKGLIRPVIDRCYPMEEIAEAHRYVETGRKRGSVVITVGV